LDPVAASAAISEPSSSNYKIGVAAPVGIIDLTTDLEAPALSLKKIKRK
jgi:hypothetical protein